MEAAAKLVVKPAASITSKVFSTSFQGSRLAVPMPVIQQERQRGRLRAFGAPPKPP